MNKKLAKALVMALFLAAMVGTAEAGMSGSVTLTDMDSYDFETGEFGYLSGGDLYFKSELSGQHGFFANNFYQRGLVDIGIITNPLDEIAAPDIGSIENPLPGIVTPGSGYYHWGVLPLFDHTYVSLVHGNESNWLTPIESSSSEDNFIFFRITDLTSDSVTLDYFYGPSANASSPVPIPATMLLFGSSLSGIGIVRKIWRGHR
jgi:hypothetical protein